ncbi:MAG: DUF4328 domain-containing protein [Dysgonomonas sp.]
MEELRPNDQRARYAIAMIWVILFLNTVILIMSFIGFMINEGYIPSEDMPEFLIWLYAAGIGYAYILVFLATIASIITFIMWFRRAYYNLHQKVTTLSYGDGWAAGAWFIPFVNLYLPFKIMKELYQKTEKYLSFNIEEPYKGNLKTNYVNLWWTLWIISSLSIRFTWNLEDQTEVNTFVPGLSAVIQIALCIVTIIVIQDYSDAEKVLIEEKPEELEYGVTPP